MLSCRHQADITLILTEYLNPLQPQPFVHIIGVLVCFSKNACLSAPQLNPATARNTFNTFLQSGGQFEIRLHIYFFNLP